MGQAKQDCLDDHSLYNKPIKEIEVKFQSCLKVYLQKYIFSRKNGN